MHELKACEFFITGIDGLTLSGHEQRFLANNDVGGVILFKRNIESLVQVIVLNHRIISSNPKPPLIYVDQEGGRVARLRGLTTDVPPLHSLEKIFLSDPHQAFRLGAMQARELAALGFHLNFAPVCDVLVEDSEVIGDRAFSSDAETAARFAKEYVRGLQGSGVAGCAKHFPGHGATAVDSHLALPTLDTSIDLLRRREFLPFMSAIECDVATIMTAHIITRAIDTMPATLSEKILTGILRQELGFNNVIISDDLNMKAVADNFSLSQILEMGINAGVDLFIIGSGLSDTEEAIAILDQLLATNEGLREKAHRAQTRISALRARFIGTPAAPDLALAQKIVRSSPHLALISSYQ